MQAQQRSVSFFLVKDGKEEYITTINENGEQNLRNFYERKGLGKFIKVVPEYTDEEKEQMRVKRELLQKQMEANKLSNVQTVTDTVAVVEPKRRGRKPNTQK